MPECLFLTSDIKQDFNDSVDRTSQNSKLQYLQLKYEELLSEMQEEQRIHNYFEKYPFTSHFTSNSRLWHSLGFYVTILLNFLIILAYHTAYQDPGFQPMVCKEIDEFFECKNTMSIEDTQNLFKALGSIHLICAILVLWFQLFNWRVKLSKIYKANRLTNQGPQIYALLGVFSFVFSNKSSLKVLYFVVYTVFSFVALSTGIYLFYSIHLLTLLYKYPSLQNVVNSIYYSRKSLIITYVFIIVIIYYFSL